MRFFQCLGTVLWAGSLMAACGCSRTNSAESAAAAKAKSVTPVAVRTVQVEAQDVQRTSVQPATVHPFYETEIRAHVSGYIRDVKADIGDAVEAGAVLAVVDVPELDKRRLVLLARSARQTAEEEQATAQVQLAEARVKSVTAQLEQSRSELRKTEASLAAAEAAFARTSDLVERQSLEPRLLDESRKQRDSELAGRDTMLAAIVSAEAAVGVAEAELAAANADFRAAQANTLISQREIEELDALLSYATIKTPFAGIVTQRFVAPGDLMTAFQDGRPLFMLSQVDRVRVHIPVPEADATLINRGDAVSLVFPSFPEQEPLTASVTRLTHTLDPSTRTMLVEAELANPDGWFVPGMFGQASITLSTNAAARMLPARAIRFDESGGAYVYVVSNDTVSVVPVTTGSDDGMTIEVVSGLEPGQTVIDAHLKRFTEGQEVRVLE